jgi:uncharacterized membrane protein YfcA
VPILVYLINVEPILATSYSLFVVGTTSLVGSITFMKEKLIHYRTAVVFATPSLLAVFFVRKFFVPIIPDQIFEIFGFILSKNMFIMGLFAVIMIMASVSMIKDKREIENNDKSFKFNYLLVFFEGIVVGGLTGLVGAGGGFLIIPALVLLIGLPMKMAVGTSLLIISVKSLIGFLGDVGNLVLNWEFLLFFTFLSVIGIFIGSFFSKKISSKKLKPVFGWFVLVMGTYILIKEIIK